MAKFARLLLVLILNLQDLLVQHISYLMLGHGEIYRPRSLQSIDWIDFLIQEILEVEYLATRLVLDLIDIRRVESIAYLWSLKPVICNLVDVHAALLLDLGGCPRCAHDHDIVKHLNSLSVSDDQWTTNTECILFDLFPKLLPPSISLRAIAIDNLDTPGAYRGPELHLEVITYLGIKIASQLLYLLLLVHWHLISLTLLLLLDCLHSTKLGLVLFKLILAESLVEL